MAMPIPENLNLHMPRVLDELLDIHAPVAERAKRLVSDLAVRPAESRDPLVYDLDWNETARLASWRQAVEDTERLPPLLGAAVALLPGRKSNRCNIKTGSEG